jgi:hypothetical protein
MISPALLPTGLSAAVALSAISVSLLALRCARVSAASADERARVRLEELQATVATLQKAVDTQSARLSELQQESQIAALPAAPRSGLNLCKRSQVLRLHRKGDPLDRIAAALDIPLQEVDLLIKVHRIVLTNL